MKVFISWSGELSEKIGKIFRKWMPKVIQSIQPYFTPSDIEKGSKWDNEISTELSECNTGIIILTENNLKRQWLMFEAGALSNKLDKSRVCPILFNVDNSDLTGPLATFQTTEFKKNEIRQLMSDINMRCGEDKVDKDVFEESFEMFWPNLKEKVAKEIKNNNKSKDSDKSNKRTDREILKEVLEITRMLSRQNSLERKEKDNFIRDEHFVSSKDRGIIESYILDYLGTNKIDDLSKVEPNDICEALEEIQEVRRRAGDRDTLMQIIFDFITEHTE